MNTTRRVSLVAGAVALSVTGFTFAETNDDDLRARIKQMEAELAELRADQGDAWLTERRATEIRSVVHDVLADADTRASLLQGAGAGWDDGFFLGDANGNFLLNVGGQIQARYMLSLQDSDSALDGDSTRGGFSTGHTKLIFSGHVVNPDWTYRIETEFDTGDFDDDFELISGGELALQDAWINHAFGNGVEVRVGQFKLPFAREELVHSSKQLAVERSLITGAFTLDRGQGVMLHGQSGDEGGFRWGVAFSDGLRSANTPSLMYDTEWAFTGRAEFMVAGNWNQFDDFTSWNGEEFAALIGAAVHYEQQEFGTTGFFGGIDDEVTTLVLTGDAQVEFGGANLFGAVYWADFDSDADAMDFNPFGFVVQGGVFLSEEWEVFGRFEYGDDDDAFGFDTEELLLLTGGVNYYISGNHNLKWTTDVGYAFDGVSTFWAFGPLFAGSDAAIAGYRPDFDDEGQLVIRSQLQLLF